MIRSEQTPINFRSVSEQRYAMLVMLQDGSWNHTKQAYLTHETQLQEISQHFQDRHKLLRVSHALLYEREGKDLNANYPQCPRQLLHDYHVTAEGLGEADPGPAKVKNVASQIARRKMEAKRKAQQQQQMGGAGSNNTSHQSNNNNNDNNDDDDDQNDSDGSFLSSSAAVDARSQLEQELLRAANSLGVDTQDAVDPFILSPSKYARPNTFSSGSHAKRPPRDSSFVFSPSGGRGGGGGGSSNAEDDDDDTSSAFGLGGGSNRGARTGGGHRGGSVATSGGDDAFFLTDMTIADDGRARAEDEAEEQRVQREMQQSFRAAAAAASRSAGSSVPKLPPISQSSGSRLTPPQTSYASAEQFLIGARNYSNPYRVSPARNIGNRASPKMAMNSSNSSTGVAMSPSKYLNRKEPVYSSLLTELRSTRHEVEEEAKRSSTLQAIANLGGTPEFRRTVTRIFANPEDGDRISDEEMRRRQKLYEKMQKQQQAMEAQEQDVAMGSGGGASSSLHHNKHGVNDAVAAFERDLANVASKLQTGF